MSQAKNLAKMAQSVTSTGTLNSTAIQGGVGSGGNSSPTVTSIIYPGNDTAVNTAGGDTVTLNGTNFNTGVNVIINGTSASVVTRISSTQLTFTAPAQATGSYIIYVVNTDGTTGLAVPGLQYSPVPSWTTAAGSLASPGTNVSFSTTVAATGDAPVIYSLYSGSLPSGITLNSTTGVLSGTTPNLGSSTTYNFTIRATDAQNQDSDRAFSITIVPVVIGQVAYTTPGTYTWVCPAGVTSVSVVCVGAGAGGYLYQPSGYIYIAGGGGGALAYANNIGVTPGQSYQVIVGAGTGVVSSTDPQTVAGFSSFNDTNCKAGGGLRSAISTQGGQGGIVLYGTGGSGGNGGTPTLSNNKRSGGGGAGGYSGPGGDGGVPSGYGSDGQGGGGGGGGGDTISVNGGNAGGGGGVGIYGQGANGAGGAPASQGSPGSGGIVVTPAYSGGLYGGGGLGTGGNGAVRIIWPGTTRQFPSTGTADQ